MSWQVQRTRQIIGNRARLVVAVTVEQVGEMCADDAMTRLGVSEDPGTFGLRDD